MLPANAFAHAMRNHWAIENQNHWVRDVTLAEDASRIRVNPGIMARLRSQTLNIARANGVTNIAEAPWAAALSGKELARCRTMRLGPFPVPPHKNCS